MIKQDLKRVFRTGILNFQRNNWLSTASITVMTLVLLISGGLLFFHMMTSLILSGLSDKIDVSIYLKPDTQASNITVLKNDLLRLAEVKDVVYISQDEALARFKEVHKENALILDSLAELNKNPLQASINVKANQAGQFEKISDYLLDKNYSFIDKVNFFENKAMIQRLGAITGGVRSAGLLVVIILAGISLIIAFNTIRMAIYSNREEIQIMKLVGASDWYIRAPFIVEGIIQGLISALIAMGILYPLAWVLSPRLSAMIPEFNLLEYFQSHALILFVILLCIGIILGVLSSMIAIRKYLKEV